MPIIKILSHKFMRIIPSSELIINHDGSIFHLHLKPGQVAPTILLVGDPGRVDRIAGYLDTIELRTANREFVTVTGSYKGKRISVISTGIGTDNIDIVLNELDALFNIDFGTRTEKADKTRLTLLRIGTCGAIQPDLKIGDLILLPRTRLGLRQRDGGCISQAYGLEQAVDNPLLCPLLRPTGRTFFGLYALRHDHFGPGFLRPSGATPASVSSRSSVERKN